MTLRLSSLILRVVRTLSPLLLSLLMIAPPTLADDTNEASSLRVEEAWVRQAPPGASALAGYMTLVNEGTTARQLSGATSADFDHIMLHRTEETEGVTRMVHQHHVDIDPGDTVLFAPGGLHLMLMHPDRALDPGDTIMITLQFADGADQVVEFIVRGRN